MIINLTKSVLFNEMCRIKAISRVTETAGCLSFVLSQEAIIGFATELLWLYDDINEKKKIIIETHPLIKDMAPNQAIGFYLTPSSPTLMIKINYLDVDEQAEVDGIKEIYIRHKEANQYYYINNPIDEVQIENQGYICLESYELSRRNIGDIVVYNTQGENITNTISSVIIEINREGIKNLATMLFVWSNNCNGNEYLLAQNGKNNNGYNLGIILTKDSVPVELKTGYLGTIYDYIEDGNAS